MTSVSSLSTSMRGMALTHKSTISPSAMKRWAPFDFLPRTKPTKDQLDAYEADKVNAIRTCNISALRELLHQGKSFDACNKSGESLLHLACRRGDAATVRFLIEEAAVPVDVTDVMGRSALHDACWRPRPSFEIMDVLLDAVPPSIVLARDMRGHTCLDYCRKEDRGKWAAYFRERRRRKNIQKQ